MVYLGLFFFFIFFFTSSLKEQFKTLGNTLILFQWEPKSCTWLLSNFTGEPNFNIFVLIFFIWSLLIIFIFFTSFNIRTHRHNYFTYLCFMKFKKKIIYFHASSFGLSSWACWAGCFPVSSLDANLTFSLLQHTEQNIVSAALISSSTLGQDCRLLSEWSIW